MASLDSLPADQRAVLQLLLKQGKSYDDLSGLLRIETDAVRERARDAIDALGPDDPAVDDDRRDEIADYLLGQQTASQRAATREYLQGSASGRSWARATSGQLRDLAPDAVPEVPAEREEVDEAFAALDARTERRREVQSSSRVGGILVLVGIGIALAVALIFIISGGDDDDSKSAGSGTTSTAAGQPKLVAQAALRPASGQTSQNGPIGIAFVAQQGSKVQLGVQARGLQPSTRQSFYAIWLYNSPSNARFLGFVPTPVGQDGQLQALSPLQGGIGSFKNLLITRESKEKPTQPGSTVLRGPLQKPTAAQQRQQQQQSQQGTSTTPNAAPGGTSGTTTPGTGGSTGGGTGGATGGGTGGATGTTPGASGTG